MVWTSMVRISVALPNDATRNPITVWGGYLPLESFVAILWSAAASGARRRFGALPRIRKRPRAPLAATLHILHPRIEMLPRHDFRAHWSKRQIDHPFVNSLAELKAKLEQLDPGQLKALEVWLNEQQS